MKKRSYTGFLPAKKLKLSAAEKRAAVKTLKLLEDGTITSHSAVEASAGGGNKMALDMSEVFDENDCGSVGCIAGWMWHFMPVKPTAKPRTFFIRLASRSCELEDLTMAKGGGFMWMTCAEAKHAARALRNYLTTGKAQWHKAMGKDA